MLHINALKELLHSLIPPHLLWLQILPHHMLGYCLGGIIILFVLSPLQCCFILTRQCENNSHIILVFGS